MKRMKKLLAWVLAFVMCLSVVPASAWAAAGDDDSPATEVKTITFDKNYSTGGTANAATAAANGLVAADGYILGSSITPYEMWSWQDRFLSGYTPDEAEPTGSPYVNFPYGYSATESISASAESTIFGNGRNDMRGSATITLDVDDAESKLIDTSKATMELVAGDGYTPEEWILYPENLDITVKKGKITFTPTADVLDVNNSADVYGGDMGGASRGWNQFGGDGNGCYTFYMEISGITYDGVPVDTVKVPIEYYIYGRDGTDRGEVFDTTYELPTAEQNPLGLAQTDEIQWTYAQAKANDGVPNLTDDLTDDFYVTWPAGTDASAITEDDVTITLYADDAEYTLVPVNDYGVEEYQVYANSEGETQISISFMHWAYVPVFKTMTITVDGGEGLRAEKKYDVVSVYVYLLQAGGTGSYPGNTVTFNVVGVDYGNIDDVYQLAQGRETYTLSTNIDGTDYYIMEDGSLAAGIEVPSGPTTMIGPPDGAKEFVQYYTADEAVRDGYNEAAAETLVVYDPRQPAIDNYCIFSQNRYDQVVYLDYTVSKDSEGNPVLSGTGDVILDNVSDSATKASDYVDPDTVEGLAFTKTLGNGTGNGMLHTGMEMEDRGVTTLPGYTLAPFISPYDGSGYLYSIRDDTYDDDGNVIDEGAIRDRPIPYEHWAWQSLFSAGWVSNEVSGNDFSAFPYVSFPYGYEAPEKPATEVSASAESTIFGNGRSDMRGSATITLDVDNGQASLIDTSKMEMELVAGDGYTPEEWILNDDNLTVTKNKGTITFTPRELEDDKDDNNILDVNNDADVYSGDMGGASRGWNQFGGDGNGCYTFYVEISGITYDGLPVDTVTIPVEYYIYGRDGTDRGEVFDETYELPTAEQKTLNKKQTDEIQWTYAQAEENDNVPNLTDDLTDDFYITWPLGTDASGITEDDVTITLYADNAEYTLVPVNAYGDQQYSVFSTRKETQIAVTFMHWAYVPVFKTMTITVDDGNGLYAEYTTDIVSVYVYLLQAGGTGSYPGNTVTFNVVGVDYGNIDDVYQLAQGKETYTLSTNIGGTDYYIMEDGSLAAGIEVPSGPTTMIGPPDGAKEFVQYYTAEEAVRDEVLDEDYTDEEAKAVVVYDPRQPAIDNYCIFSQNRYDQVVYLDYTVVTDDEGNLVLDPVLDDEGNPVTDPVLDAEGNPVLDDEGNPVTDPVLVPVLAGTGDVILDNVSDSPTKASDYVDPNTVEGLAFTKTLGNGTGNGMLHTGMEMEDRGVNTLPGYTLAPFISPYDGSGYLYSIRDDNYDKETGEWLDEGEIPNRPIPYEHWAWQSRFSAGWVSNEEIDGKVSGSDFSEFPYVSFPYGYAAPEASEDETTAAVEEEEEELPTVTVTSNIFGSADTGNKSTLKPYELIKTSGPGDTDLYYYNEDGERVKYENYDEDGNAISYPVDTVSYTGKATISITDADGSPVDDSEIDSRNAVVKLVEGDGYYPEELVLAKDSLSGTWVNGKLNYTLKEGDLEWYTADYKMTDPNSGREWSCFGGDGNGYYTFNFEVSGIKYEGEELDPAQFTVNVYIWGRDGSDRVDGFNATESPKAVESSSGLAQTRNIQWTWVPNEDAQENDDPILCDEYADDFFITWPTGSDASKITADDVTVTLYNKYGDSYTLPEVNDYGEQLYAVFSSEGETQVALTFMHWAYTPVFTEMTITVDDAAGLYASKTYDVDSVYIYMVQQGGGGVSIDGTMTAYSYYGFDNLDDIWQIMTKSTYTLSYTDEDGTVYYYAEDEDGNGYLSEGVESSSGRGTSIVAPDDAVVYDADGEEDTNQQLIVNTAWITSREGQTVDKEVVVEVPEVVEVTVTAESSLFGSAYTGGVTCPRGLDDMTGEAVISLAVADGEVDDSLIDSSKAVVSIADGDGYHASEMLLTATELTGEWKDGQISYTLNAADLDWNNDETYGTEGTSLQWSVFGGDGNGCYIFNFQVSGIEYDGVTVDPVTFPVLVYIYGRSAEDLGKGNYDSVESAVAEQKTLGLTQTKETQWTWVGDDSADMPILCDNLADDFYITWPHSTDASNITADDVTVTLYSDYGDSYTLSTETAYGEKEYSVFSSRTETQVAVTFMHWPYVPVYTTMTISVDDGNGMTAEKTYDIGSVYVYMIQSGGLAVNDGQTVTFDFYGFDPETLTDVHQLIVDQTYTLSCTDEDGTVYFYAEDEDENGYLSEGSERHQGPNTYYDAPEDAVVYDATEDRDPILIGSTAYTMNRLNQTEVKTIDGEEVVFNKAYTEDDGDGNVYHTGEEFEANGLKAARGYVMCDTIYPGSPHSMWSWQTRFLSGWTEENGTGLTSFPYVDYPYGYAAPTAETEPEETEPETESETPAPAPEPEQTTTAAPTTAASSGSASDTTVSATTSTKLIQLRAIGGTKRVTLKWNKVNNADGYLIYGARCGVGYQVIADVTDGATKKYVVDGLEKGKSYKYRVKAYKIVDGEQVILRSSNTTHVYTHGNKKYANAKKVTASKTSVSLSVGKTSTIKATITMANSKKKLTTHVKELRYRSNNKKVATVSSTGVITAVKAGTANIYAYSPNGRYAKIKVTVK